MAKERAKILVVDDEDDILDLLRYNLEKEGFEVLLARDGAEGIRVAEADGPDLIILDVMMPRMDGIEVCRRLRAHSTLSRIPVVMLTARSEEGDQVEGLDAGADIYLAKPISLPVLLSQVRATLRGAERASELPDVLRAPGILIDRGRFLVELAGIETPLYLPRKEFQVLFFLASTPGFVFSRQELLNRVWGEDVYVVDRTVDVHVRKIREKIGDGFIETVKGVGYRFRAHAK
jgi:two-component system, OmpR family, alkaline phosphatase synthesis response regulator PhoP